MKSQNNSRLKQVEQALRMMPKIVKRQETQFIEELRFANKIFGRTIKEIHRYSTAK